MHARLSSLIAMLAMACSSIVAGAEPVTDPSEAPPEFRFVGEYVGSLSVQKHGVWRPVRVGLQVVALGQGRFKGVEYLHGLPGAGWNGEKKAELPGELAGNVVKLDAVPVDVVVDGVTARVGRTWKTPVFGTLRRINRASPTLGMQAPPAAKVLFANGQAQGLTNVKITDAGLLAEGAATKQPYSNFTLHLEYRLPLMAGALDQHRSNSGVYLQRRYEVQILDSFGNDPAFNGAGAIYRTKPADVSMSFPPLAWQTYDIRFQPARFKEGEKLANARVTVWHNGVKIHDDYQIPDKTGAGKPEGPEPLPILFQNHHDPVRFRNIWIVDHTQHPDVVATPQIVATRRGEEKKHRIPIGTTPFGIPVCQ